MAKTLNQFLEGTGILKVKSPDEQRFVDKHVAATIADRNGNGDDVFKGSKVKKIDRRKERHGYESGEDAKVYEEAEGLDEISNKTLKSYTNKAVMGIDPESGTRNPNSISMLKKKAKAHATLGNDQEASRLKSKAKKRDQGLTKAYARIGGITPASGSPVDKAKNKIPSSYLNRYEEVEQIDEGAADKLGDKIDAAPSDEHAKKIISKASLKNLHHVKHWNMGLSGAREHKYMKHVDSEINKRYDNMNEEVELEEKAKWRNSSAAEPHPGYDDSVASFDPTATYSPIRSKANLPNKPGSISDRRKGEISKSGPTKGMLTKKSAERLKTRIKSNLGLNTASNFMKKEEVELEEKAGYSAKAGAAGKDLGKPGKNFAKIARSAAEKYGSEAAGKRVAGAVLKKLRKEDHLIDLLDTVSESQAFTMVTVFNSLSEENQDMFLASCETEEGVEMMLDFSIQNRGAE